MAASFSAWAPAFLQHKADSELEREEALGLARLLQATHPDDVGEAQTSPALRLAQNVLGHLLEALDDAADHLADAEARAEHFESVASGRAHDAAARAAPPVATNAENAENAGDSANVEQKRVVPDHAEVEVRKQLQRRLLDAEQELAHLRQCAADAEAHAKDLVSANAELVAQRDALEATAQSTIAPETNEKKAPSPARRYDVPTKDTSDADAQTDAPALPVVDPNALVDPVQAAAMIAEAKATSAAAHAAVRAEMESRRAFAAECTSSVRAALAVNEALERQLVEAVAARRAAETRVGVCVSEARRWEKALEKHRAFDALRRATEARRRGEERARGDGAFQSEAAVVDSEVVNELASAAVQCQRRRRGALGRREARAYRDAILAEDRAEWAAEERDAAIVVQSAFRGHRDRRDAAAAAAAATRVQSAYRGHRDRREVQGSKDARIVASLVRGIVERVVEATDGAERTSAVKTLVRESLARVEQMRRADDFSDDETSVL
jgi:hypothetical protein